MSDAAPTAPVIRADAPGSFPHRTLADRHPAIIRQVRAGLPYEPQQRRALDALLENCTEGVIEPLPADAPDRARWASWGMDTYGGQSWFDVPWLWAESYFYRLLLDAVGFFGPGAWRGVDPFRPSKTGELDSAETGAELSALDGLRDRPAGERNCALLSGSLWGNRADLSFQLSSEGGEQGEAAPGLVADDSDLLWTLLPPGGTGTLCLVADNAGRELVPDLLLIAALLTEPRIGRAVLHLKPTPYYVSDATTADVIDALHRLRAAGGLAAEYGDTLWSALGDGRLVLRAHPFSCSPLPYADMPDDLRADFAAAGLTLFKGDLNYRRLVGDRYWPATTPFDEVTAYFPGPVAALRTLKSEVITGLSPATEAALDKAEGRKWLTSGTHALIQVNPSAGQDGQ
ncbi:damage-control phosphatase ARMT1 family protein [Streptomyces seoulensis]|uniref:damage-control phosphatase ARMT1 family protein n=1 Tax=Streptomyces seoulensis TaxID=73044 RepID=UPI0036562D35